MAEQALSSRPLYSARPTVRIDGRASDKVTQQLGTMNITESEGGMSSLELSLDNTARFDDGKMDLAFEDEALVRLGTTVSVHAGDEDAPREIFRGLVTGMEASFEGASGPALLLLAEDALQRARLARRTQVHLDTRIASLAQELATRMGMRAVVDGFDAPMGPHVQLNESDLAFLRRLLASRDGDLQVVGEELHVAPRKDVRRGTVELALHSQLRRARVMVDLAHQATEVSVSGWNALTGSKVSGRGTGTNLGPGGGRQGAEVLRSTLGARAEHLGDLSAMTDAEARALADAAFDQRARRFVCVEGTAEGNPSLRVGTHLSLRGLGRRYDNTYYVVRAHHRYDLTRGYETDFEAECAFLGGP
ncbi:phage late control D family protein [Myxococcus sp. CA051A]|uniref:phage late control D family protein n=1 Tax=unclassified Myxococcus TaxID=2648731 RepID=UPI00157B8AFC|nr:MULTISPECIES: contractile injection system protein, VgrG/Pvc8 family [unclassified Myxococcus]NTX06650.1 phage late control D family protein [Myxococcus sp. CA040A]NTX67259.1 phage late control D family protein [Myxococcus sp. CA051A]